MSKTLQALGLMLLGPLAFISIYLVISRWPQVWFNSFTDIAAIIVSLAIGVFGIRRLPIRRQARVALAVGYVGGGAIALFFYSLAFLCAVMGHCL